MNRRLKGSIFLILIFSTVAFFISSILYIIEQSVNLQPNSEICTPETINFTLSPKGDVSKDLSMLNLDGDYSLFKSIDGSLRGEAIYFKGNVKNKPEILQGRYFNEDDFNQNKKVAIIGKELLEDVIKENGKEYYYIANDNYEVIGVLGNQKKESGNDYSVYINLDALLNKDSFYLKGSYSIDAALNSREMFNKIKDKYQDTNIIVAEDETKNTTTTGTILKENLKSKMAFIIEVVGTFILSTVCVTEYWIKNRKKEIGIKRALGATKMRIFSSIIGELSLIAVLSFLAGYAMYLLISYLKDGYIHFYMLSTIVAFLVTFISGLITTIVPILNANKMQPAQIMR